MAAVGKGRGPEIKELAVASTARLRGGMPRARDLHVKILSIHVPWTDLNNLFVKTDVPGRMCVRVCACPCVRVCLCARSRLFAPHTVPCELRFHLEMQCLQDHLPGGKLALGVRQGAGVWLVLLNLRPP